MLLWGLQETIQMAICRDSNLKFTVCGLEKWGMFKTRNEMDRKLEVSEQLLSLLGIIRPILLP